ncbi:MAG: LacI family transcriptional regulator [Proteobacteria bacterium]|nr:MAG: LacI family transcriptional regulator [Pseudomonadota bacterium]
MLITRCAALAAMVLAFAPAAVAQPAIPADFPKRPLTLILPLAPGGPVDVLGRLLAQEYQIRSGEPTSVENRTGGAGNIGIDAVRRAAPDGTTLLVIPAGSLTINPTLMPNLSFDVERDFAPITILGTAANLFVVSPGLGVTSIAGLIARSRETNMSYGSPGVGSQLHLAMELFKQRTGVEITHVPYRGTPPALTDLLGGHIQVLVSNLPVVLPVIREGKVVPLAMTTAERSPLTPEIPTLAEAGVAGIDVTSWYGLLAPKATPKPVLDAIFAVTKEILASPALQRKLEEQGLNVVIEPPDVFARRIRNETAMWRELIRARNITAN